MTVPEKKWNYDSMTSTSDGMLQYRMLLKNLFVQIHDKPEVYSLSKMSLAQIYLPGKL